MTFIPAEEISDKAYSRRLKKIEEIISAGYRMEKIETERNDRNKSSYVWPEIDDKKTCRIKLEIGSSVRPDPYSKKSMKTYIQEYLEEKGMNDYADEYKLKPVTVNTLDITRTFLDKVMAVKRHAICGTLPAKVRHVYDVTQLFSRTDIQKFLEDKIRLKSLLRLTKETDGFYLQKRRTSEEYDPTGTYAFDDWKKYFDDEIRRRYETLNEDLLYTSEKQEFYRAVEVFGEIDRIFAEISE